MHNAWLDSIVRTAATEACMQFYLACLLCAFIYVGCLATFSCCSTLLLRQIQAGPEMSADRLQVLLLSGLPVWHALCTASPALSYF